MKDKELKIEEVLGPLTHSVDQGKVVRESTRESVCARERDRERKDRCEMKLGCATCRFQQQSRVMRRHHLQSCATT